MSTRPSKQPSMVGSTLGVYTFGLIFVSAEQIKDIIIIWSKMKDLQQEAWSLSDSNSVEPTDVSHVFKLEY